MSPKTASVLDAVVDTPDTCWGPAIQAQRKTDYTPSAESSLQSVRHAREAEELARLEAEDVRFVQAYRPRLSKIIKDHC